MENIRDEYFVKKGKKIASWCRKTKEILGIYQTQMEKYWVYNSKNNLAIKIRKQETFDSFVEKVDSYKSLPNVPLELYSNLPEYAGNSIKGVVFDKRFKEQGFELIKDLGDELPPALEQRVDNSKEKINLKPIMNGFKYEGKDIYLSERNEFYLVPSIPNEILGNAKLFVLEEENNSLDESTIYIRARGFEDIIGMFIYKNRKNRKLPFKVARDQLNKVEFVK